MVTASRFSMLVALQKEFKDVGITSEIIDKRLAREKDALEAIGTMLYSV